MTEKMLTEDLRYTGTVIDITPRADSFEASKGERRGQKMYCHFVLIKINGFTDPFNVQICNYNENITEFQKGDDIKFIAGKYNMGKNMYAVKFDSIVATKMSKVAKEYLTTTGQDEPPQQKKPQGEPNTNPMVAGSLWSVCLTAAIALHKDDTVPIKKRATATATKDADDPRTEAVLTTLHRFREDFIATQL